MKAQGYSNASPIHRLPARDEPSRVSTIMIIDYIVIFSTKNSNMQDVRALDSRPFIPEGFGNFLETVGQGQKCLNNYGIKLFA